MKIFFSPVSGTDPIALSNFHDGAMLHIARHYQPDKIYLYMSSDILRKHKADDRYRHALVKLGERIKKQFDIEVIERPELEEVQLFEPIFADFEEIIEGIVSEAKPEDEILINITSGTPSMKSSLLVLATMIDIPCKCIQVNTPERKMNKHEYSDAYNVDDLWILNPDNGEYPVDHPQYNRTHEEQLPSLKKLKYEEIIKKYVNTYNFHAAYMLAEQLPPGDTVLYKEKLLLADKRQELDQRAVDRLIRNYDSAVYSPVRNTTTRSIYEYTLSLQAKVARAEYGDFLRGLSPLFKDLFEGMIKKQTGLTVSDFTCMRNQVEYWDMDKIDADARLSSIRNVFEERGRGSFIKTEQLLKIMEELCTNSAAITIAQELRTVERNVRNQAAHTIVSVSDQWILQNTGKSSSNIIRMIRKAFTYSIYNVTEAQWNSYDDMAKDIIRSI